MLNSPFSSPRIVPPAGHPRLLVSRERLGAVRANFRDLRCALAAALFDELLTLPVTGEGATPEFGSYDLGQYLAVEAEALKSLLDGDRTLARKAADDWFTLADAFGVTGGQLGGRGNMNARWGGHLIFISAEVYDWCYDVLTDAERERMIAACETVAADTFEMGYPPERQAPISGHGAEAQLLRDLLAFSVAVYDERPDIYDWCAGRLLDEYAPEYRTYLASGVHPQGPSYGAYRWTCLCWAELIFRAMGASVFGDVTPTAEWLHYMTRPDGEALRLGDDFYETKDEDTRKHPFAVPLFLAWALTGREDFRAEAARGLSREYLLPSHRGMDYYVGGSWGEGLISPTAVLLFDGLTAPTPAKEYEPCRYFGFPVGMTVYRGDDLTVMMKAGELWNANHDHLDTGSFQIYCGAPLITESGVYDSYGTTHRRHYLIRTCAHSCLTVRRTDRETFGDWKPDAPYDGGTRRPCGAREPKNMEEWMRDYRMARVLEHREGPDGCFLSADLSEAYAPSCARVRRTFDLAVSPAADGERARLCVTDEVTAFDESYAKCFNVQCQTAPGIDGRTATIRNGRGRVEIRVLSPEDAVLTAVGGEGRQFFTDGTNYPPTDPFHAELGWGRLEITPGAARETDVFRVEFRIFEEAEKR